MSENRVSSASEKPVSQGENTAGERVLVCGGRDYWDRHHVYNVLMDLIAEFGDVPQCIIHGGAAGADAHAAYWALGVGVDEVCFEADWGTHGRAAGPIRNQRMIDEGKPTLVMAFPGGRGTADMVRRARAAGLPVRQISARAPAVKPEPLDNPNVADEKQ